MSQAQLKSLYLPKKTRETRSTHPTKIRRKGNFEPSKHSCSRNSLDQSCQQNPKTSRTRQSIKNGQKK
ncbi:MAG: hypothetical protein ACTSXP_11220, partial [Promethearchaeota archaeon]